MLYISVSSFVPIFCEVKRNNPPTEAVVLPVKKVNPFSNALSNPFSNAPPNPLLTTLKTAEFSINSVPDLRISLTG